MRSIKKVTLLVAAAAAVVAIAAPAAASAAKIEAPAGKMMPVGLPLYLTSIAPTFETSWGKLSCGEMTLPGELTINNGETVKAVGGLGSAKTCFMGGTKPFTLEPELRSVILTGPQSGTMDLKLKAEFPNNLKCTYERADTPVWYTAGSSQLNITKGSLKAVPAACGPFLLTASFNLKEYFGNTPVLY